MCLFLNIQARDNSQKTLPCERSPQLTIALETMGVVASWSCQEGATLSPLLAFKLENGDFPISGMDDVLWEQS